MDLLFRFSLLLTYLSATKGQEKDKSCLSQPEKIFRKIGQSVVLQCSVSCSAKDLEYEWFVLREYSHRRLDMRVSQYSLKGADLHINPLQHNDSGIYFCAAASRGDPERNKQHVGMGTTLVVREKVKVRTAGYILVWLTFVLLAIYSLAIATLIIKKYGCNTSASRKMHKTDKNNSAKKKQFRNVLQEMYSKKNFERSKQTARRSRSQVEAASTDFSSSTDDVYQNV